MFDKDDARVLGTAAVLLVGSATAVLSAAAVAGLAVRLFQFAAG